MQTVTAVASAGVRSCVLQLDLTDLQVGATDVPSICTAALHQPLVCSCPTSLSAAKVQRQQARSRLSICLTQHAQQAY